MLHAHLTLHRLRLARLWRRLQARCRGYGCMPITASLPLATSDIRLLPDCVTESPVALHYWQLLGRLDWAHFPTRDPARAWPGIPPKLRAPYVAAFLVKLDQGLDHMTDLRTFLVAHPGLVWLLGFELAPSTATPWGFDADACLPTQRQFSRVLRTLPNPALQFLLDCTLDLVRSELPPDLPFGDEIALDTKHIIAWVKENNPNRFAPHRCDKTIQPPGDPDCKLGCKERNNRHKHPDGEASGAEPASTARLSSIPTPTTNPVPADLLPVNTFYWGYASGVVVTRCFGWGEFVLAEYTQPFNASETSYFYPLMQAVERRLGRPPRFGALDKAFDAHFVYDYFDAAGGFAAVPLVERCVRNLHFAADGRPLCDAGLAMPLKGCYTDRSHTVVQQKGRYVCPLFYPEPTGESCPVGDAHWQQGGCVVTTPTSPGPRIRVQLDRSSDAFKQLYAQRTMAERIFSQAKDLGIERPKLRNQRSVANLNTLTYILLNLYAWQRCQQRNATRTVTTAS